MTTIEQLEQAKVKVLEWIASGKFTYRSIMIGDQKVEFSSLASAVQALKTIDRLIAETQGTFSARTCAISASRFMEGCR